MRSQEITLYAIRETNTHKYMPERLGRGSTHDEPDSFSAANPRLFRSESAAKRALTWWRKGPLSVDKKQDYFGDYDEVWHEPGPSKKRQEMNMEVVAVKLRLPGSR